MLSNKYRIVLLGNGGVGKSCLTTQFCQNLFLHEYDPTIENMYRKQVTTEDNRTCILEILDTAGQEEFSVMRDQYIRAGDGFMLVYGIDSRTSFESISGLHSAVMRVREGDTAPIVIVAAKADLEIQRTSTTAEGFKLATSLNCPFVETSAKSAIKVDEAFMTLLEQIRTLELQRQPATHFGKKSKKSDSKCTIL